MLTINRIIENTIAQVRDIKAIEKTAEKIESTFSFDLATKLHKVAQDLKEYNSNSITISDVITLANRLKN